MTTVNGLIVKGIAGFYYVKSGDNVYRCKARGIFKQEGIKPAVGDLVTVEIIPENDDSLITEIMPRKNSFIRPFIVNVDCFVIVTAAASPVPVLSVIDKFLVMAEKNGTDIVLCVNKCDLAENGSNSKGRKAQKNIELLKSIYEPLYPVVFMGDGEKDDTERLKELIKGKNTALAGPSGVGKSTILNRLIPEAAAETGVVSHKSDRGKHTTRHTELFQLMDDAGTMIFDTPGFTSFDILEADEDELQHYYPEMSNYLGKCRYSDCRHISEPGCEVLEALKDNKINPNRYESYKNQLEEIKKGKQY